MNTFEMIVSGRVQGVGYRNYAQSTAIKMNINGSVKNENDGTVRIIAQTDKETVDQFKNQLSQSQHPFMRIDDIDCYEITHDKIYKKFEVVY